MRRGLSECAYGKSRFEAFRASSGLFWCLDSSCVLFMGFRDFQAFRASVGLFLCLYSSWSVVVFDRKKRVKSVVPSSVFTRFFCRRRCE